MRDLNDVLEELRQTLTEEPPLFKGWIGKTFARIRGGKPEPAEPTKTTKGGKQIYTYKPGTYKPPKKWTSAGGVVLQAGKNDRVYVIKPSNNFGPWAFPKGRVDKGESMKQAAIREVFEETGLKAKIKSGKSYLGKGTGKMSVTHFWIMIKTGGHPSKKGWETEKVLYVKWEHAIALFKRAGNRRDILIARAAMKKLGVEEGPEYKMPKPKPRPKKKKYKGYTAYEGPWGAGFLPYDYVGGGSKKTGVSPKGKPAKLTGGGFKEPTAGWDPTALRKRK